MEIFDYDNILLLPRKCRVQSRSECDPSVDFGPRRFKLPVVPANMKTVLDEPIAEWRAANDHLCVMHRFDTHNLQFAKRLPGSFVFAGNVATPEALIDLEAGRHLVGLQQPGDARGLHPRLARVDAGQDQRGFSRQRHRRPLLGVQVVQQLAGGGRRNIGRPLAHRRILGIGRSGYPRR